MDKKYAIISLVPAIHIGYLNLFRKYPGTLYIVGKEFISDFPHIERDIRTPDIGDLKVMLKSLGIVNDVVEVSKETIKDIPKDLTIVSPDDEITLGITEKYLGDREVVKDTVFLRWNKQISTTEFQVSPDRTISESEADKELIKKAEMLAEQSSDWWRRIGTIIVKDGMPVVTGFNKHFPSDFNLDSKGDPRSNFDAGVRFDLSTAIHSEACAISTAAKEGISVKDASIYVTTFPCPSCAYLIAISGIKKVFYKSGYSLLDAEKIFKDYGIEVVLVK